MKRFFSVLLIVALLLCSCTAEKPDAKAEAQAILQEKLEKDELYSAEEVSAALLSAAPDGRQQEVLADILLPASLGITLPKIDVTKVVRARFVPLTATREGGAVIQQELMDRGYGEVDLAVMSYQEYLVLENSWLLSEEEIESMKAAYPELAGEDLSQWTKGQRDAYNTAKLVEKRWAELTVEQQKALNGRKILSEDLTYLLKEYMNVDVILQQKDEDLRALLEDYYYIDLEFHLGDETSETLLENN